MLKARLLATVRLFFGVLTLATITIQILHTRDLGVYNPVNFFSYFTNLSNIFVAIVLISGAYVFAAGRKTGVVYDVARGASVTGMVIVGIVYGVLLSGEDLGALLPWVNVLLHYIMPVVALADWLLFPPKARLRTKNLTDWLLFPIAYVTYTLVRGGRADWYPYPFLDPSKVGGGYLGVAGYCVVIAAVFAGCGWLLITYANMMTMAGSSTGRTRTSAQAKLKKPRKRS